MLHLLIIDKPEQRSSLLKKSLNLYLIICFSIESETYYKVGIKI
jgi:hypothetical protein